MAKIQKAQREIEFQVGNGNHYLDSGQALSIVNRKLFSQQKLYGIERIDFEYLPTYTGGVVDQDEVILQVMTAGETWSVHNAWVKSKALHSEMQDLVLADNPSIKGKWADYKVFLDYNHAIATGAANMIPVDGIQGPFIIGEWNYSTFVMPQHEVDPATGLPLPADECFGHLIGDDIAVPNSKGLVKAYAQSRATVQPIDPSVPAGMSTSFFNLLTDSGSQEPELADVIEDENDEPPYDQNEYPGGATNANYPLVAGRRIVNSNHPNAILDGFIAQCGLVLFTVSAKKDGEFVTAPTCNIRVTYAPGMYKGVAAIDMGQ
ncbi:MAG: hypothetical protein [Circoviridae sp.]|nr:MAG: hypothetical protein [Circoviridae sp.]